MREKEFLPLVKSKLGIDELNAMQRKMLATAGDSNDIILLSATGSGKTLAFLLPVMKILKAPTGRVQCVIIAPSRELVIQICNVARQIAQGFKVTPLYGGHNVEDEVNSLSVVPDIIVATPGRLLDHIRRRNVDVLPTRILVLDEFDKSLELGFEEDMSKIIERLKNVSHVILTSATDLGAIPDFVPLDNPLKISYLEQDNDLDSRMRIHRVESDNRDKLESLFELLESIVRDDDDRTIVFVNHRESAERVADFLKKRKVASVLYHGALDQIDREKAVAMFNNGSAPVMVATDLASRGLDIEGVSNIVHYHLPLTKESYIHRNGRTARASAEGDVYVMFGPDEKCQDFIVTQDIYQPDGKGRGVSNPRYRTLYISAGKKDKLSKGDIAGWLMKDCGLSRDDVGKIDVYDRYSLVAVARGYVDEVLKKAAAGKIKGSKRKVSLA